MGDNKSYDDLAEPAPRLALEYDDPSIEQPTDEVPPDEDSPHHILNALNNFCIRMILKRIENASDFLSAAEACTRFQANAKECFPSEFRTIRIQHGTRGIAFENALPYQRVPNFVRLFGHFIEVIQWDTTDRTRDSDILNLLAEYCGKSLKELRVTRHNLDFNTPSQFQALETIELFNSTAVNFGLQSQLRSLIIKSNNKPKAISSWFVQAFPNLREASFSFINQLTSDMVIEFTMQNPQLINLEVINCHEITTTIFDGIATRLPNLERLRFDSWKPTIFFDEHMIQLCTLKKLNCLGLESELVPADILMTVLNQFGAPIEDLKVWAVDMLEDGPTLPLLKKIELHGVNDKALIGFVRRHRDLEKIHAARTRQITMNGILYTLRNAAKLTDFFVWINQVNLQDYNSILALARGRVKVRILTGNIFNKLNGRGIVNISWETLLANREWLELT